MIPVFSTWPTSNSIPQKSYRHLASTRWLWMLSPTNRPLDPDEWEEAVFGFFRSKHPKSQYIEFRSHPRSWMLTDLILTAQHRETATKRSTERGFASVTAGRKGTFYTFPDPDALAVRNHGTFGGYTYAFTYLIQNATNLLTVSASRSTVSGWFRDI